MTDQRVVAAVDLGASGGRVMAGLVGDTVALEEVHRFPNAVVEEDGHLRWDIRALYDEVLVGLGELARRHPEVESVGIDTWAVDYGLLDRAGNLLGNPVSYRDDRTAAAVASVHERIAPAELYARNGLQFLPFNTIFQLEAERAEARWAEAARVVLLPDLLAYWLTGELATEATNASTTGLVDVHTGDWSDELLGVLDLPRAVLPPIQAPGTVRGAIRPDLREALGLRDDAVVTTVASHDTASAVVGVPALDPDVAYIASGTWSLVGLELDHPVTSAGARAANFTNERGVDGTIRFLSNVGGLWLLQESMRSWGEEGLEVELDALLRAAADVPAGGPTIDVGDEGFIAPGTMPGRIALAAGDPTLADDPPRLARCVLESLAAAYAATLDGASALADRAVSKVHVVGGGSQNGLLCQLTADSCGRPVTAGPVEATALGNVLVQARAIGAGPETLDGLRQLGARGADLRTYEPRSAEVRA